MVQLNFPLLSVRKYESKSTETRSLQQDADILSVGHLVVASDDQTDPEVEPSKTVGFLLSITLGADGTRRYEVFIPDSGYTLSYDHIAVVADDACPKVYWNDGVNQGCGELIGMTPNRQKNKDGFNELVGFTAVVRVPPFNETRLMRLSTDEIALTETITLGVTHKPAVEAENA